MQATKWFDSLKNQPLDFQIKMISERLLADTNVCTRESFPDRIITNRPNSKIIRCESAFQSELPAKPLIVINYKVTLVIKNNSNKQEIVKLSNLLTPKIIDKIELLQGPAASALYGSIGIGGAIIITVSNNKSLKKFKDLYLNS